MELRRTVIEGSMWLDMAAVPRDVDPFDLVEMELKAFNENIIEQAKAVLRGPDFARFEDARKDGQHP